MKQVIIMRNDLNMRKGKMIAQGAHASVLSIRFFDHDISPKIMKWFNEGMTKICVRADSEAELLELEQKAVAAGISVVVVTDAGRTEFGGVPTKTCLAIGPDEDDKIDGITGHLKLL